MVNKLTSLCRVIFLLLPLLLDVKLCSSQTQHSIETITTGNTSGELPFWFRSMQSGNIPLRGNSTAIIASSYLQKDSIGKKKIKLSYGLQARLNLGATQEGILSEAWIALQKGAFQFKAGRTKDRIGLADSLLTSGNFSVSGNALGIPSVSVSVPEYRYLLGGNFIAFKGNFLHGWLGHPRFYNPDSIIGPSYFHQKSLYLRLGKPEATIHWIGGFNHQVYWGREVTKTGKILSVEASYLSAIQGSKFGPGNTKIGNHLGSIDAGMDICTKKYNYQLYHSFFYDVGGLIHGNNLLDGLSGISIINKQKQTNSFNWKRFVVEFLYTLQQGGYPWSVTTPSGDENYYNAFEYVDGWSYLDENLGSPFLTTRKYARKDLPQIPGDVFINNRVWVLHLGCQFFWHAWEHTSKLSFSRNYGTFGTSPWGHSQGEAFWPTGVYFPPISQFSLLHQVSKKINRNWIFTGAIAFDYGDLYYNSIGTQIGFKYLFTPTKKAIQKR